MQKYNYLGEIELDFKTDICANLEETKKTMLID